MHLCSLESVHPAGDKEDEGYLYLCLRTDVESVKRKSERQALCCIGKVYGCWEIALGSGGHVGKELSWVCDEMAWGEVCA